MPAKDLVFTVLGIDRASHVFDNVGRSMDRMGKTGSKSMGAMLASSLAASTGIAGALGGVSLAFSATAAVALSQNAEVAQSFRDLGQSMKSGLVSDAGVLEDEMVGAAHEINSAFQELRPQLREVFAATGDHIDMVVDGATGFMREAMPGMVTAAKSAGPVFHGLQDLMKDSGQATSDFLEVVSEGAPAAGYALSSMGDLVQGVLPNVGRMLVNLSGLWVEHGDQVVRIVTRVVEVITDLSESALPTVSDAFGVALDVLEGVLSVIEPMSGALGPLIGMWLSLSLAMRGLSAVRGVVDSVGTSVGSMREKFDKSPGAVGKLTTAVGGAMSLLGGPWGIAVAGATAMLAIFGQESQQNAQDQRSLAGALKESGGAFDENARDVLFNSEAYQDIQGAVERAGLSHKQFLDAIIDGGPAYDDMIANLKGLTEETTKHENRTRQGRYEMTEQGKAAHELLGETKGLREMVVGAVEDFQREQEAVGGVSQSMAAAKPGADSLAQAIATLGDKTADTATRADALNDAWMRLMGIPVSLEQVTSNFEAGLDNMRATIDEVKKSTENWRGALIAADGQVDLSNEAGRKLSGNLIKMGEDYRTLAQTAYDSALQRTGSEGIATLAATAAAQQRRAQFIAEAQQMGFNADQARRLADRYFGLPDDVMTLIRADSSNAQGVVDGFVNRNNGKTITIYARAVMTGAANAISAINSVAGVVSGRRAIGGPVQAGQIYEVGEQGRELFMAPADGQIIPNGQTERFLSSLRATSTAATRTPTSGFLGAATPAPMQGAGGFDVRVEYVGPRDPLIRAIMDGLRVEVKNRHGGSVTAALNQQGVA